MRRDATETNRGRLVAFDLLATASEASLSAPGVLDAFARAIGRGDNRLRSGISGWDGEVMCQRQEGTHLFDNAPCAIGVDDPA